MACTTVTETTLETLLSSLAGPQLIITGTISPASTGIAGEYDLEETVSEIWADASDWFDSMMFNGLTADQFVQVSGIAVNDGSGFEIFKDPRGGFFPVSFQSHREA